MTTRSVAGDDASEAGVDVLERQLAVREPVEAAERLRTIRVDTTAVLDDAALDALAVRVSGRRGAP